MSIPKRVHGDGREEEDLSPVRWELLRLAVQCAALALDQERRSRERSELEVQKAETETMWRAWRDVYSNASHIIGNSITSLVYLLKDLENKLRSGQDITDVVEEDIPELRDTIENARHFLRDFRVFTLSYSLRTRMSNVGDLIQSAIRSTPATGFSVKHVTDGEVPEIVCDPDYMKMCLAEFIQNAHDAGASSMEFKTRLLPGSKMVEILITDDGPGIPSEIVSKVLTPMFTTKKEGTGLGLAIVKDIVERHKGAIKIESNNGHGARFVVRLPVADDREVNRIED